MEGGVPPVTVIDTVAGLLQVSGLAILATTPSSDGSSMVISTWASQPQPSMMFSTYVRASKPVKVVLVCAPRTIAPPNSLSS